MTTGDISGRIKGVSLLATGVFELIPQQMTWDPADEALLFHMFAYAILRTKVGAAVTTTARIRIGGNATHDDVAPLYVVPGAAAVGAVAMPPLVAAPFVPVNLRNGPISFEVERAAVGPSAMTGDILLIGMLVSG